MRQIAAISRTDAGRAIASAKDLGDFVARAQAIASLPELTDLFAATIAPLGYDGHLCVTLPPRSLPAPLFGDLPEVPRETLREFAADLDYPRVIACAMRHHLLVPVECWHDHPLCLMLRGVGGAPDRAALARLQGFCEVYATYGYPLLERQQDIATNAGLGIVQRRCLALVLTGHPDYEIADVLDLTPFSVRAHIDHAMDVLGTKSRAEAVATAARRGWLVGIREAPDAELKHIRQ